MFEIIISYSIYIAIFLTSMTGIKYISYKSSIRNTHKIFKIFANKHKGLLNKGSFLVAPSVSFSNEKNMTVSLRSYYLYKGRRGNYTEVSLKLDSTNYLTFFNIEIDKHSKDIVRINETTFNYKETLNIKNLPNINNTRDEKELYKKLIPLIAAICEKSSTDLAQCQFNGEMVTIRVLQLFETIEELDIFYKQAHKICLEALEIIKKS